MRNNPDVSYSMSRSLTTSYLATSQHRSFAEVEEELFLLSKENASLKRALGEVRISKKLKIKLKFCQDVEKQHEQVCFKVMLEVESIVVTSYKIKISLSNLSQYSLAL